MNPAIGAPREPLLLDVRQAAAFLGVGQNAVRHWVERRHVPFRRIGGRVFFVRAELLRFLETAPGVSLDEALNARASKGSR